MKFGVTGFGSELVMEFSLVVGVLVMNEISLVGLVMGGPKPDGYIGLASMG